MAEKQDHKSLPKYLDPEWLKSKVVVYRKLYGHKILVFLFFVLISSVIWFFSALGRNYVTSITFPVKYNNFPSDKVLVNELPNKLSIKIQSIGSTILSYKMRIGVRPVIFDVSSFLKGEEGNSSEFYLLTSRTRQEIQDQLPTNISVVDIEPDTIYFQLTDVVTKNVKVIPDLEINFQQQYMQKGSRILIPDSVTVSGPQVIVDTVEYVTTKTRIIRNINDTVRTNLELVKVPKVKYSHSNVELIINAEKYTEAEIIVPVQVENLPDSLEMKIFPKTVTINYKVGLSDFGKIYPNMFEIALDYNDAIQNLNRKADISLLAYPEYVSSINYFPKTVEFVIER